jgi:predicted phosphodiesterase
MVSWFLKTMINGQSKADMKTAVISDIHANLEAFEAVLKHAGAYGVDEFICLGDVVGYNADPEACVELVCNTPNMRCILGNHDAMAVGQGPLLGINTQAQEAMTWTREHLSEQSKTWLAGLPLIITDAEATYCHASLEDPSSWLYVQSALGAARHFMCQETRVAFMGHSHMMFAWMEDGENLERVMSPSLETQTGDRWLVSIGSVGQPRDLDPRAGYVVFDHDSGNVTQFRLEYDLEAAKNKILESSLPDALAARLG